MIGFVGREINERRNIHDLNFNGEISFDTETYLFASWITSTHLLIK